MTATATNVLDTAHKYMGVTTGSTQHRAIIDKYNSVKPLPQGYAVGYHDDWCDTFVSFVAITAGATDLIGRECGVERHINIFKKLGIWIEDGTITPRPGDIITYNWDKSKQPNDDWADHIGIVEKAEAGTITVIEGNYGGQVKRRTISTGWGYIRGYARPKYATTGGSSSGGSSAGTSKLPSLEKLANDAAAGKYGNGKDREKNLGNLYPGVQAIINHRTNPNGLAAKTVDILVKQTLTGVYGNGADRKARLGTYWHPVQDKINKG